MINNLSIEKIAQQSFGPHFCKPIYDTYGFAQIPATIERLLLGKEGGLPLDTTPPGQYDKVVLFLIDGFGWKLFEKYSHDFPFLDRYRKEGIVSKLTSQFPSTTTAHITCLNTGLEVGQTGIYEWFYYEPKVGAVIAPFLFSFAGDKKINTLSKKGILPQEIFPFSTFYQALEAQGTPSFIFQHDHTADEPYSQVMFKGAQVFPYKSLEKGLKRLQEQLAHQDRGYFYFYCGDIDSAAHRHGLSSSEVFQAVKETFEALENFIQTASQHHLAILCTADHGIIDVDPHTTFYLNKEIPELSSLLKTTAAGKPIVPTGSCRDFFVHVAPEHLTQAKHLLSERLQTIAEVHLTADLIKKGFFGNARPAPRFLDRVGDLVILPFGNHTVWWYEENLFTQKLYAMHGGLSRDEIEIPFACLLT